MKFLGVIAVLICLTSCYSEYHQKVQNELASGVRYDSLFFGLKLGMTRKEFFDRCWELNRSGIVWQSNLNNAVRYKIDGFKHEAKMDFYPNFYKNKVFQMPVEFQYVGWNPVSQSVSYDSLELEVLNQIKEWFGTDVMKMEKSPGHYAWVWVHGNRRILLTKLNDQTAKVIFTDLLVEAEMEENE